MLAVSTLRTANGSQAVQLGYDLGAKQGFATVPAALGLLGNTSREDVTPPLQTMLEGGTIELHVIVDGQRIEIFFGGAGHWAVDSPPPVLPFSPHDYEETR